MFGRRKRTLTRLLIVEDEPLVAFDTEHFLSDEGYEIVGTVDRVADAVAAIEGDRDIHLILVDVSLADGSGIEVAKVAHQAGIQVMFVTGSCPGEARDFAAGCLSKPYAQRDLLAAIDCVEQAIAGTRPKKLPSGFALFMEPAA